MQLTKDIATIEELTRYIRKMLGEPLIEVELTDDHIHQVIADTVKMYTDVAYGFLDDHRIWEVPLEGDPKVRYLDWDEVVSVTDIGGKGNVPFKWDSIKRVLTLMDFKKSKVLVHGQHRYIVDPHFDLIFNESWVKDMSKAKCQLLWGQVLGKYSQNLVGGATINYDRLISEAQSEIERLTEELTEKWTDPAPVLVG